MAHTQIPFLDLRAQHDPIRQKLRAAFEEVLDSSAFAGGPYVSAFEKDFAAFCGTKQCIGVGNGTDALWLALLGLGIAAGDEVITVSATFIATAEAISYCGATPVFVDIDDATCTMSPALIEQAITPRTKAIIPVHLYGQMADMDPIMEIARRHGLFVIEDACQAHGAEYRGRRAGSIGHAGCFSFYPGKNLGAIGEAGAVVTNDNALSDAIRVLRDHGQKRKYYHSRIGWNARMDGMQAAALRIKLERLAKGNALRRDHARLYTQLLADNVEGITPPHVDDRGLPAFHLYVVRVQDRDRVLQAMGQLGISCGVHYPVPVHLQEAYAGALYRPGSLPVTERWASEVLSLPMFPELTSEQIMRVVVGLESAIPRPTVRAAISQAM